MYDFSIYFNLIFISFGPYLQRNTVAYDEDQPRELEKAVLLQDAISDLPAVLSLFWTSNSIPLSSNQKDHFDIPFG